MEKFAAVKIPQETDESMPQVREKNCG